MSLETLLYTALHAVCYRVYPDVAPERAQTPYLIYQQVGGDAPVYTEGALPDKLNASMQISAWADTRQGANTLMRSVEAALVADMTLQAVPQSALIAAHDDDVDRRGAQQDFSIWCARSDS